jgi:tight adherence protein C
MEWMIAAAFGMTIALGLLAVIALTSRAPVQERLRALSGEESRLGPGELASRAGVAMRGWVTQRLALLAPKTAREADTGEVRRRLIHAGYRAESAVLTYMGSRVFLALLMPLLLLSVSFSWGLYGGKLALALCGTAAVAFVAPSYLLDRIVRARQDRIERGLPDALDLMVVCIEAGLGINASLARVAQEFARSNVTLSEEFELVTFETRAGKTTTEALRSLSERTGVSEVSSLVAMLVQTERFGTNLADTLRVYADGMRIRRVQRAEELAAQAPLKMLFPTALFIFPATLAVTIGPGLMQLFAFFGSAGD